MNLQQRLDQNAATYQRWMSLQLSITMTTFNNCLKGSEILINTLSNDDEKLALYRQHKSNLKKMHESIQNYQNILNEAFKTHHDIIIEYFWSGDDNHAHSNTNDMANIEEKGSQALSMLVEDNHGENCNIRKRARLDMDENEIEQDALNVILLSQPPLKRQRAYDIVDIVINNVDMPQLESLRLDFDDETRNKRDDANIIPVNYTSEISAEEHVSDFDDDITESELQQNVGHRMRNLTTAMNTWIA